MIAMFEVSPPIRRTPKIERIGPMTRFIWMWFSIAYFHKCGINDIMTAVREDERERIAQNIGGEV
jgi:hypothetical protein